MWTGDDFSTELNYNDDNFKILIKNKIDSVNFFIIKEICIDEITKDFNNLKVLFKRDKNMSKVIDENTKFNLLVGETYYNSDKVKILNENYFYVYFKMKNQDDIVEKF